MPTTTEQIADLIAASTALKQYFEGWRADVDAGVAALRASALATLFVDSAIGVDDPARTGLDPALPLRTPRAALARVIQGGVTTVALREAQDHWLQRDGGESPGQPIEFTISFAGHVRFVRWGTLASRPQLRVAAALDGAGLNMLSLYVRAFGDLQVEFNDVDLHLPAEIAPGGGYVNPNRPLFATLGGHISTFIRKSEVVVAGGYRLLGCTTASVARAAAHESAFRGGGRLLNGVADACAIVSMANVAFFDGTKICDGGTVGVSILSNAGANTV